MQHLRPDSKLIDIAASPLLEKLSKNELVVYFKLVAMTAKNGKKLRVNNADFFPDTPTGDQSARIAIHGLKDEGLLKITFPDPTTRIIEVL